VRWGAISAAVLLCAHAAAAEPADPAAAAGHAAKLCEEGDLQGAAEELRSLLSQLEAEFGAGHAAPQILRVNLAEVERNLGNEAAAKELSDLPPEDPNAPPMTPGLKKALRGLAVCATARAGSGASAGGAAPPMPEVTAEEHVNLSRKLVFQGQYQRALEAAQVAQKTAGSGAPAPLRMQIHETLAVADGCRSTRRWRWRSSCSAIRREPSRTPPAPTSSPGPSAPWVCGSTWLVWSHRRATWSEPRPPSTPSSPR
jgi:hypothetical protein